MLPPLLLTSNVTRSNLFSVHSYSSKALIWSSPRWSWDCGPACRVCRRPAHSRTDKLHAHMSHRTV